jgi:hypothetical protein
MHSRPLHIEYMPYAGDSGMLLHVDKEVDNDKTDIIWFFIQLSCQFTANISLLHSVSRAQTVNAQ